MRKRHLRSDDAFFCLTWLSQAHPEIFKEFNAVNDVRNKASDGMTLVDYFGQTPIKGEGSEVNYG